MSIWIARAAAAACILLAACAAVKYDKADQAFINALNESAVESAAADLAAPEQRPCGKVDRDWLKQLKPAEGSILIAFEVSRARRGQVEQLNGQLASIAAELKKYGCLEIKR